MALGFTGSYGRVVAFAGDWRAERQREQQPTGRGIFVPLSFRPGEAFQFDWSEDYAVIGGERSKLTATRLSAYKNILNRLFAGLIFVVAAFILYRNWKTPMIG